MRHRRPIRYSSLTSLLDVLFILVFASLTQAAGLVQKAEQTETDPDEVQQAPAPKPPSIPISTSHAQLRDAAQAQVLRDLQGRPTVYARISADGHLLAIERDGTPDATKTLDSPTPLLLKTDFEGGGTSYLGNQEPQHRICTLVRKELALNSLDNYLVIFAPEVGLDGLQVALARGLRADQQYCFTDEGAIGVLVDPDAIASDSDKNQEYAGETP